MSDVQMDLSEDDLKALVKSSYWSFLMHHDRTEDGKELSQTQKYIVARMKQYSDEQWAAKAITTLFLKKGAADSLQSKPPKDPKKHKKPTHPISYDYGDVLAKLGHRRPGEIRCEPETMSEQVRKQLAEFDEVLNDFRFGSLQQISTEQSKIHEKIIRRHEQKLQKDMYGKMTREVCCGSQVAEKGGYTTHEVDDLIRQLQCKLKNTREAKGKEIEIRLGATDKYKINVVSPLNVQASQDGQSKKKEDDERRQRSRERERSVERLQECEEHRQRGIERIQKSLEQECDEIEDKCKFRKRKAETDADPIDQSVRRLRTMDIDGRQDTQQERFHWICDRRIKGLIPVEGYYELMSQLFHDVQPVSEERTKYFESVFKLRVAQIEKESAQQIPSPDHQEVVREELGDSDFDLLDDLPEE